MKYNYFHQDNDYLTTLISEFDAPYPLHFHDFNCLPSNTLQRLPEQQLLNPQGSELRIPIPRIPVTK